MTGTIPRFVPVPDSRPEDEPWPEMVWPIPADTELRGSTVTLTPLEPSRDAEGLFHALDSHAVWAYFSERPDSPAQIEEMMSVRKARADSMPWVVRTREGIVGTTSYLDVNTHDARLEIGYTLYSAAVWATAVNPETKLLLLGYAFDTLGVGRVQLKTDTRNIRSQQAIARLGAQYEGTLRRHFRRFDGTVRDSVMFSVVAEDWPTVRDGLKERLGLVGGTG
ncbi:GNAT family N-acetyltransferase [Rhodococcus sp. NPDC058521]|uniref:GNAT family N-acetyltransferase n=1 Tax=Rhodococcus sp. NPDC058521 TaxID=3346536 RepID=UPI003657D848